MQSLAASLVLGVSLSLAACAASPPPVVLRVADFGKVPLQAGRPIVLAFKAGERLPVVLDVSGEVVEIDPRPTRVWLVAKRDFFLRIDGTRLTTSLDGVHFDRPKHPGSFRFGFGADAANGPHAEVVIVTPVHAR